MSAHKIASDIRTDLSEVRNKLAATHGKRVVGQPYTQEMHDEDLDNVQALKEFEGGIPDRVKAHEGKAEKAEDTKGDDHDKAKDAQKVPMPEALGGEKKDQGVGNVVKNEKHEKTDGTGKKDPKPSPMTTGVGETPDQGDGQRYAQENGPEAAEKAK